MPMPALREAFGCAGVEDAFAAASVISFLMSAFVPEVASPQRNATRCSCASFSDDGKTASQIAAAAATMVVVDTMNVLLRGRDVMIAVPLKRKGASSSFFLCVTLPSLASASRMNSDPN